MRLVGATVERRVSPACHGAIFNDRGEGQECLEATGVGARPPRERLVVCNGASLGGEAAEHPRLLTSGSGGLDACTPVVLFENAHLLLAQLPLELVLLLEVHDFFFEALVEDVDRWLTFAS